MSKLLLTFIAVSFLAVVSFGQTEIRKTVYFDFNVPTLSTNESKPLDSIVQQLYSFSTYEITLSGHTDTIGSNEYNDKLSGERVNAVKNYLISRSVDGARIAINSFGRKKPIALNSTP